MRWQRFRNLYAEADKRRRSLLVQVIAAAVAVTAVFFLTALLSGGHWQLAAMAAVGAILVVLMLFVLLGGLKAALPGGGAAPSAGSEKGTEGRHTDRHGPVGAPAGEAEAAAEPGASGEGEGGGETGAMVDRYYFKGAWFTVTIHPRDEEGRRIDLAGPLCPKCHEPMLRALDREPMEKLGENRTEVYRCRKSTLHPQVSVQLSGKDDVTEQARSACLHEIATGRFASDLTGVTPESEAGEDAGEKPGEAPGAPDATDATGAQG
ncbi:MAG: hypothetical protein ACYTGB_17990 [Planctomycetota bacterium]|jgi:hypothetical protein